VTERALLAAAALAEHRGHGDSAEAWQRAAKRISSAFESLYNPELGCYRKSQLLNPDGQMEYDDTVDISSIFGVMEFGGGHSKKDSFTRSIETAGQRLFNQSPSGGVIRYEHDNYFLKDQKYPGNPWIICTLWLARYYIYTNQSQKARGLIDWAISTATPSGVLAEQVDPDDKSQVGVSPLVWSHAELADTILLLSETVNNS
jgi:GH15 family glucan-1,4-alpha-glucosidase